MSKKAPPPPAKKDSSNALFRKSNSVTSIATTTSVAKIAVPTSPPKPLSSTLALSNNGSNSSNNILSGNNSSSNSSNNISHSRSNSNSSTATASSTTSTISEGSSLRTNSISEPPTPSPTSSSTSTNPTTTTSNTIEATLRPSEPMLRPSPSTSDHAKARLSMTNLTPKFPQVMEQLEANLVLLSRIIVHIKKVVATREAFAVALVKEWGASVAKPKILPAATPKKPEPPTTRIRSTSQTSVRASLTTSPGPPPQSPPVPILVPPSKIRNPLPTLLQKMESMAEIEGSQVANFCIQCKVGVISPLERLRDTIEESRKKIERDEKERRLKFDETKMRDELHRRKQKCLALWVNLQGMHKNRADARKILKFLVVIKGKFVKYQNMVNSFNNTCDTYYNAVPFLIQAVQKLEFERIDTMRNVLRQYCLFWHQLYAEPAKEAEAMLNMLEDPFNTVQDQKDQWLEVLAYHPIKNWDGTTKSCETPSATFDLPCMPEELIPGFGTDPTRGPYVHKFDGVLRAVLQAQQKENVTNRKISVDEDQRRLSRHFDKQSDDDGDPKHPDGEAETPEGEDKAAEDPAQGDLALAIYKQMFGCEPGELGHPILVESGDEDESSESSEEEDDDD